MRDETRCPCGTGETYRECCGPIHGGAPAVSAEALMRSRYSAFARGDEAYLLRSWHPDTRPAALDLDPGQRWTGLEVLAVERGGMFDAEGVVEFRAHHRGGRLHERSLFKRDAVAWVYWGEC